MSLIEFEKSIIVQNLIRLKFKNHISDSARFIIATNSMKPILNRGDYVYIQPLKSELKIGDIIAYTHWSKNIIVHRIVDVVNSRYVTKGDHNKHNDPYLIELKDIIGIVKLV